MGQDRRTYLKAAGCTILGILSGCSLMETEGENPQSPGSDMGTPSATQETSNSTNSETMSTGTGEPTQTATVPEDPKPLAVSGNWPSYQLDKGNTGVNQDRNGPRDAAVYWQLFTQGSTPLIDDGEIILLEDLGNRYLVSRKVKNGRINWKAPIEHGGIGKAPLVFENQVVTLSYGMAQGFNRNNGDLLWKFDVGRGQPTAPVSDDSSIYFCNGKYADWSAKVFSLDKQGNKQWTKEIEGDIRASLAYGNNRLFVPFGRENKGGIVAFGAENGRERWRFETSSGVITPSYREGVVYAAERDGRIYALSEGNGSILWQSAGAAPDEGDGLAVSDSSVYVAGKNGLLSLSTNNGNKEWVAPASEKVRTPTADQQTVYFGSRDRRIRAVDSKTGELQWEYQTESKALGDQLLSGVYSPPVVVDGGVVVLAADGLYAFGPSN